MITLYTVKPVAEGQWWGGEVGAGKGEGGLTGYTLCSDFGVLRPGTWCRGVERGAFTD